VAVSSTGGAFNPVNTVEMVQFFIPSANSNNRLAKKLVLNFRSAPRSGMGCFLRGFFFLETDNVLCNNSIRPDEWVLNQCGTNPSTRDVATVRTSNDIKFFR